MIIYTNRDNTYCFIHIPKNSGKHIRNTIQMDKQNKIVKAFWGINKSCRIDMAHIPFMLKESFISPLRLNNINYYTYVRNPYNRIISAFFYKNKNSSIDKFKSFVKNVLIKYNFNKNFDKEAIHYYPQHMFICDDNLKNNNVKFTKLENQPNLTIREYKLSDYFNGELINIINTIYELDFKMFDYEMLTGGFGCDGNRNTSKIEFIK